MYFYRKLLQFGIICILICISILSKANNFEGYISFVKKTHFDTTHINYYVKDDKVRISQYSNDGFLLQSLLIHITREKVFAIDPEKQLYRDLVLKESNYQKNQEKYVIKKTKNHREVNGIECYQWRVRDKETKSEIVYWVTQNHFDFMDDVIRLLAKTDRVCLFFSKIPSANGYFPMLSVERTLLRKEKQRITVREIDQHAVNDNLFKIPSSYIKVMH